MFDIPKQERDYYESQDKEQLIVFLLNGKRENELLHKKIRMLTGCSCFGNSDPMDGSCVDCYYENQELHIKCRKFQNEFMKMLRKERECDNERI